MDPEKKEPVEEIGSKPRPAFETADDPYHRKVPLYAVGDDGIPDGNPINIDLKAKDLRSLWASREHYLWFALVISGIYLILVMAAY